MLNIGYSRDLRTDLFFKTVKYFSSDHLNLKACI